MSAPQIIPSTNQLLGVFLTTGRPAFELQLIHKLHVPRSKYVSVYVVVKVKGPQTMNCDAVCRVLEQPSEQ